MSSSEFYRKAGKILRNLERKNGSLKSLVFSSKSTDLRTKKKLYAILSKTLKYKNVITNIIKKCKLLDNEPDLLKSYHSCLVVVCDVLYGKGLRCGGPLKFAIIKHIEKLKHLKDTESMNFSGASVLPRYVRVNTLKGTVENTIQLLKDEGYIRRSREEVFSCPCFGLQQEKQQRMRHCFSQDQIIPELLIFCSCTAIKESKLYLDSLLLLQDKASCFPAHVLAPPSGSHVIDACAAPGNKTTHLASIMHDRGLIYAFDKDVKRCETLKVMINKAGATIVNVQLCDFLKIDPSIYTDVNFILVDPSCSGSGIHGRLDYDDKCSKDTKRLAQLSKFQCQILHHALTFPAVHRVVYSTCSIHKEENEYVVRNVLLKNASKFELVHILPDWPSRGLPVFTKAQLCVRTSVHDKTNGFFVAMFQSKEHSHHMSQ